MCCVSVCVSMLACVSICMCEFNGDILYENGNKMFSNQVCVHSPVSLLYKFGTGPVSQSSHWIT